MRWVDLQCVIVFSLDHTRLLFFVLPAKHGRHIGIMSSSYALSHLWLPFDNFEGMHQFHSNFTEGSSIWVIRKILTELWPFLS